MAIEEKLITVKGKDGCNELLSLRVVLKQLNAANLALRRVNFLAKTYNKNNTHLTEIEKISGEALIVTKVSENVNKPK